MSKLIKYEASRNYYNTSFVVVECFRHNLIIMIEKNTIEKWHSKTWFPADTVQLHCAPTSSTWLCTKVTTTSRAPRGVKLNPPPCEQQQHLHLHLRNELLIIFKTDRDRRVLGVIKYYKGIQPRRVQTGVSWLEQSAARVTNTQFLGEHHSGGRPDRQPCLTYNDNITFLQIYNT